MNKKEQKINELKKSKFTILEIEKDYISFEDKEGYRYRKNIYCKDFINTSHKYDKKNIYNIYNIKLSLSKTNSGTTLVENSFIGGRDFMEFKCGRCGDIFKGNIGNILKYKYCLCGNCVREVQSTKLLEYETIKKEVENLGYTLLSKNYKGIHNRINVMDNEGYKGKVRIDTLRKNGGISKFALYNPYALDNIKLFCKMNGFTCSIPNQKYNGWEKELKVKCECGDIYITDISKLINQKKFRCNKCVNKISNLENSIKTYLDELNIKYIQQYIYKDCKYKRPLPFDFYLPQYNTCIEVQGEQHYRPYDVFGGEKAFELQQKKDKIKKDYCDYNNIKLIIVSYRDIRNNDNYKKIINSLIK